MRRLPLASALAAAAVLLTAGPALAHVEVESEKAQALAENVTLSFNAESESGTAGITELRVVLPQGISPADVSYGEGPAGWTFTARADGYTVRGPALKARTDAAYSVVVRQLPDAKELAFKTLQSYSDGRTDRWIELGGGGKGPAPVLKLNAAAPGAKPVAPSPSPSPEPSPSATPGPTASAAPEATGSPTDSGTASQDGGGLSAGAWWGIGAAALAAVAASVYFLRRRRTDVA